MLSVHAYIDFFLYPQNGHNHFLKHCLLVPIYVVTELCGESVIVALGHAADIAVHSGQAPDIHIFNISMKGTLCIHTQGSLS